MSLTFTIVGRPNVGKSTLFNRLIGKRLALVDDTPGVTRDRREGEGTLGDMRFRIVDTAGLEETGKDTLPARMREQTEKAIGMADLVLFMIDARAGVTPLDKHFAGLLRRSSIPVLLLANKCEGSAGSMPGFHECYALGLGDPIGISAEHGEGLAGLYSAIVEKLGARIETARPPLDASETPEKTQEEDDGLKEDDLDYQFRDKGYNPDRPLQLAIAGRPNAGKSTLINELIGEQRLVTGPEAGITRDSIAIDWEWDGQPVRLWDTAGLRKQAKITEKLEKLSVADTMRSIRFAEVAVLLLDASLGMDKQDLKIASHIAQEGRALVIACNKWDAVKDPLEAQRAIKDALTKSLPQIKGVTTVHISALTGKGLNKLMEACFEAFAVWNARIPTRRFNEWLRLTLDKTPPPAVSGTRLKIRFGAQIKTRPPTFVLFCNRPDMMPESYLRYLENELRRSFGLPGTPIRMLLRKGKNPYSDQPRRRKKDR